MALKDYAGSIISGIGTLGGWLGIGEARQDRRQVTQQGKLNDVNAKTAKELADYEQQLKLKMWKDTNYGAQLKEADKAGVSKAAVLGGSGTGTQGASVGSVSGTGAADAASTTNARTAQMQAGMQLASQIALQKAQTDNIKADTANKLKGADKAGAEKAGIDIDNEIKDKTQGDAIRKIVFEADKMLGESMSAFQKGKIDEDTREDQIRKIKAESIGALLENESTKTGIKLDKAKINEISENILQRWKSLELDKSGQDVSERNMEKLTEAMLWGAGIQATGSLVKGIVDIAGKRANIVKQAAEAAKNWK